MQVVQKARKSDQAELKELFERLNTAAEARLKIMSRRLGEMYSFGQLERLSPEALLAYGIPSVYAGSPWELLQLLDAIFERPDDGGDNHGG